MPYEHYVSNDDILSAIDKIDGPVATVPEIHEHVPMSTDGIRARLTNMERKGRVKSKKVGARAVVWWRTD